MVEMKPFQAVNKGQSERDMNSNSRWHREEAYWLMPGLCQVHTGVVNGVTDGGAEPKWQGLEECIYNLTIVGVSRDGIYHLQRLATACRRTAIQHTLYRRGMHLDRFHLPGHSVGFWGKQVVRHNAER